MDMDVHEYIALTYVVHICLPCVDQQSSHMCYI